MKLNELPPLRSAFVLLITIIVMTIPACSKESLNRTGYKTLQNVEEQKCQENPGSECPEQESYDDYQRKKQELETPR